MKNIFLIIAIAFATITFVSCETIVDDIPLSRFPEIKEKLVLTSFISPQDTTIYVKVTISSPLFGEYKTQYSTFYVANGDTVYYGGKSNVIKDAIVTLSTGSQSVIIPYDSKNQVYAISAKKFKIEAGKTYTLTAKTKEYQVEATTTVPLENIKIETYTAKPISKLTTYYTSSLAGKQTDTVRGFEVGFSWKDIAQKENFYKIGGNLIFIYEIPTIVNNAVVYREFNIIQNANWFDEKAYPTDEYQNGATLTTPKAEILFYGFSTINLNGKVYKSRLSQSGSKINLQLSNLSKELYDYQLSLFKANSSDDNPFAEPAPVFTNVKNGLGCFASFNRYEVVEIIK